MAEQPLWNSSSSRLETPLSPNGRRAWRKWATRRRRLFRRLCRDLRSGAHTKVLSPTPYDAPIKRRVRKSSEGRGPRATPPRPFTPRSLVGMTQGARKRAWLSGALGDYLFPHRNSTGAEHDVRSDYSWSEIRADAPYLGTQLGERLRPCPGCCACWGSDISPAGYGGDVTECFGPLMAGKSKRAIANMKQYQRTLADDCDGSGVLPARNKGVACLHRGGSR